MKWTPQADGASPVIMVRSLPPGTTEQELVAWAKSFVYEPRDANGNVVGSRRYAECVKALVLHDRMLGFVQFSDIWAARTAMSQFMYDPPSIVLRRPDGVHPLNLVYSDKPEIKAQNRGRQAPLPQPVYTNSRLLLVVLKELSQMVTIDELFWIFSQISRVEKISSFTKDHKNQIVVQFETSAGATGAMDYFNGKYLPPLPMDNSTVPLCFLAIVPSKLSELTFRNQDGRNRDYTEANKLIHDLIVTFRGDYRGASQRYMQICELSNMSCRRPLSDFIWGQMRWGEGWLCPPQADHLRGRVPPAEETTTAQGQVGDCMHISGLPSDDSLSADHLWSLCGMYGEVKAVKMLFKYRGCCVVQYATPASCAAAIKHLHGLEFKGRTWDAKISRQPNATHWNGASDDLQKRMVSIQDGRKAVPCTPESATYPSKTLLLWDVPQAVTPHFVSLTISSLANCMPTNVSLGKEPGTMLVHMSHTDAAMMVAMLANGQVTNGWTIKMRFDPDTAAAPAAAGFFRMGSSMHPGGGVPQQMPVMVHAMQQQTPHQFQEQLQHQLKQLQHSQHLQQPRNPFSDPFTNSSTPAQGTRSPSVTFSIPATPPAPHLTAAQPPAAAAVASMLNGNGVYARHDAFLHTDRGLRVVGMQHDYHLNPAKGVLDEDDEGDANVEGNGNDHLHDDDILRNGSDLTSPISPATPNTLINCGARYKKDKPRPPGIPRPTSKPSSVKSEDTPTTSPGLLMFKNDTAPKTAQAFNPANGASSPWGTPVGHGTTPATCKTEPTDSTFSSRLQTV